MSALPLDDNVRGPVNIAPGVQVDRTAILGFPNADPGIFECERDRILRIAEGCRIGPWSLLYEGATIGKNVTADVRSMVGSRTVIGDESRLCYGAQIHDNVEVGRACIIAGFIADNCKIGAGCSVFGDLVHRYAVPGTESWDDTNEQGPTLGDGVIVGWGALLIGPIHIGHRARIAPKSIVRVDVPEGQRVG